MVRGGKGEVLMLLSDSFSALLTVDKFHENKISICLSHPHPPHLSPIICDHACVCINIKIQRKIDHVILLLNQAVVTTLY